LRLAVITEGFRPFIGGVETRYSELASRLARDHDVSVFTMMKHDGFGFDPPEVEWVDGYTVHRVPLRGDYFLSDGTRSVRGLASFLSRVLSGMRGGGFDAVICSEWPLAHVLPIAALRSSLCVVDWHEVWGSYYFGFGLKGCGGYLLERLVARVPGLRHVAVSNFTKGRLVSLLGVPASRVEVIPSGVDLRAFDSVDVGRDWGRLIYFGRFAPHKHIEWLIEAFERLVGSGLDLSLRVVGDGPLRGRLRERLRGVDGAMLLDPLSREGLIREIKSAWIAVIPSVREGQGISYLEAMAAGTPLVAVDSPLSAVGELVVSGRNGLLVEASPDGLVEGVRLLLRDEGLWSRISREGRRAARGYSWDECAARFRSLLEGGLSGKG
jgi:glycosyltransferase involved in cell wall biosynthesis